MGDIQWYITSVLCATVHAIEEMPPVISVKGCPSSTGEVKAGQLILKSLFFLRKNNLFYSIE